MIIKTREEHIEELKQIFNHICVLYDNDLVRLVGFYEDDMDIYYHVRFPNGRNLYASMVGWLYSLKGMIPDEKYARLDSSWTMNHCPPESEFKNSGGPDVPAEWYFPE
jgi:hypothetical protein